MPTGSGPQPWEVGEVVSLAFSALQANALILIVSTLIVAIIGQVPGIVVRLAVGLAPLDIASAEFNWVYYSLTLLLQLLIQTFLWAGLWRISLVAVRGGTPEFGLLFSGADRFVGLVIVGVLRWLAIVAGTLLLIIPGVILALGLLLASLFVVDQNLGPLAALKQSWKVTTGHKGKLFVLVLAFIGIGIIGLIACCVGLLVAMPVINLATAIVYLRLSGTGAPVDSLRPLDAWRVDAPAPDDGNAK